MSLSSCLKKAGDAILAEDAAAILERARVLRGQGMKATAAGRQAVDEQIAAVNRMLEDVVAAAQLAERANTPSNGPPESEVTLEDVNSAIDKRGAESREAEAPMRRLLRLENEKAATLRTRADIEALPDDPEDLASWWTGRKKGSIPNLPANDLQSMHAAVVYRAWFNRVSPDEFIELRKTEPNPYTDPKANLLFWWDATHGGATPSESDQDRSNREWRENFDRVANTDDLSTISTVDLERADNFADRWRNGELRKGWSGGEVNKATTDALLREQEHVKAELKRRRGKSSTLAGQLASLSDDALDALVDDAVEATGAPETEKPAKQRATTTKPRKPPAQPKPRKATSKAERVNPKDAAAVQRTSGEIAKSLGYNLSSAGKNALEGLTALFGGPGKMSSGLTFDEDTYSKAKPHFQAMLKDAQAAGRDLADFVRSLVEAFGSGVKPYLRRFAADLRNENAVGAPGNLERDSGNAEAAASADEAADVDGPRPSAGSSRSTREGSGIRGGLAPSDARVLNGGAPAAGERGDQSLRAEQGQRLLEGSAPGSDNDPRGGGLGDGRVQPDRAGTAEPDRAADRAAENGRKLAAQREANKLPVLFGDADNINATLPYLNEGQREDVGKAEARFAKPTGYGMLFTNGTGTGKTFTGLGIVRRYATMDKRNILIAAPNDKIIEDWIASGARLGLTISKLERTNTAGGGIVITTYANLGQNDTLADRQWDLVVGDEAHYLAQAADGKTTLALDAVRAITLHPDGMYRRARMIHREMYAELDAIQAPTKTVDGVKGRELTPEESAKERAILRRIEAKRDDVKAAVNAGQGAARPRAVFLSATPYAYEKAVGWSNGYLFDWDEGKTDNENGRGYNGGSNADQFMMQHFGYRMRYNKLTEPDAKVDRGLMQRQFNSWLKKQGSLSGRILSVDADYDRRFVLIESRIGNRIDALLDWARDTDGLEETPRRAKYALHKAISDKFDYLSRRYLLEAIKAEASVDYVRKNLKLGRKVVVFHDYKKGGGFNPFRLTVGDIQNAADGGQLAGAAAILAEYNGMFSDLIESDIGSMRSPILTYQAEFPGVMLFNGDVPPKTRLANVARFNADESGPQVILVQSAAGKEGISLHDTTGKHQRVLLNLGLPTQPTTAIQQEGRIYRTGQVADAVFRYFNTGTSWEKWAFATTIAQRASAAENLAQGEQARALKDAFIAGFQEADDYPPGMEGEGKGGKQRDKASNDAIDDFDRATAFYWGTEKKSAKTKAREGNDYFATPEPVGLKMMEWAGVRPGEKVLEPSAGHGAIARWAPSTASATAVEPSSELASRLAMVFDGEVKQQHFEDLNVINKYDAVVMNPPFGHGGRTAVDHMDKAFKHLKEGGRLVALIPTGPAADAKFEKWYDELEGGYLVADIKLPQVTFERAATSVATRIVILDKPAKGQDTANPVNRDLSNSTDIRELFARIRDMSIPDRPEPVVSAADAAVAAASDKFAANQAALAAGGAPAAPAGTFEPAQTKHTKTGADLFVAKITRRLSDEEYKTAKARAGAHGGWYSSFKGAGAIPGFQFSNESDRNAFVAELNGGGKLYSKKAPTFYSALVRGIEALSQPTATADQWAGIIRNLTQKGVKQEEIDWLGVNDWLKAQTGKVSKDALLGYLQANQIQVDEVMKGQAGARSNLNEKIVELHALGYEIERDMDGTVEGIRRNDDTANYPYDSDEETFLDDEGNSPPDNVVALAMEIGELSDDVDGGEMPGSERVAHAKWQLPGGENYRELLLTLPPKKQGLSGWSAERFGEDTGADYEGWNVKARMDNGNWFHSEIGLEDAQNEAEAIEQAKAVAAKHEITDRDTYSHNHWSERNVLAHVRFNERTDADGNRVLFLEEVQSDWHQTGRKRGYKRGEAPDGWTATGDYESYVVKNEAGERMGRFVADSPEEAIKQAATEKDRVRVPDAPFKTTWPELVLKRMVRYAADNGFSRIAWTTGEQQADRYDLSRNVETIGYVKRPGEPATYGLSAIGKGRNAEWFDIGLAVAEDSLADHVGKDVADKIIAGKGEKQRDGSTYLSGLDLKVGGEGMRGFYDDMLPKIAAKLGKKWGAKVGAGKVKTYDAEENFAMAGATVGPHPTMPGRFTIQNYQGRDATGTFPTRKDAEEFITRPATFETVNTFDIPPAMAEAATAGMPLFSQPAKRKAAAPRRDVKAWLTSAAAELEGAADIRIVDTMDDLRAALPDAEVSEGVYTADDGVAYIVAGELPTVERAQEVFAHEVFGHLAMERSPDMKPALQMVKAMHKAGHRVTLGLWEEVAQRQPGLSETDHAKEVIALMAERGVRNSAIDRLFSAVKALLRKIGVKLQYSDAELRTLIARAARSLQREAATAADRRAAPGIEAAVKGIEAAEASKDRKAMRAAVQAAEDALAGTSSASGYLYSKKAPMSDALRAARERVMAGAAEDNMSVRDRMREAVKSAKAADKTAFRQGVFDFAASIEKYERAINGGNLLDAAKSIYKQVLSTQNLGSVMTSVLKSGIPVWKNGSYQVQAGRKGLAAIFEPLTTHADGNLTEHFEFYAAARRASRLITEGRENLFTQAEIDLGLSLAKKYPALETAFNEWQDFNREALDMMEEAGLIDPEARKLWERNDYVPFYRAMDEAAGVAGPGNKGGVANQRSGIRTLKGGEAQLGNIIENMMMNVAHAVDSSFKNRAALAVADSLNGVAMTKLPLDWKPAPIPAAQMATALRGIGVEVDKLTPGQRETWAKVFRPVAPAGQNIVTVMRNGKPEYYEVLDPLLLRSITAMRGNSAIKQLDLFGMVTGAKRLLTNTVTAHPHFIIANFIRDTLATWVQSPLKIGVLTGTYRGFRDVMKGDPDFVSIMAAGGGGGNIYDSDPATIRKLLLKKMPGEKVDSFLATVVSPRKLWAFYRRIQMASENANRLRVYRAALAGGATQAEAVYQARDVLNFSLRGDHAAVQALAMSVPFFNARLQGLYRLQRGYKENRAAFLKRGLFLMGATLALLAANWDDDRYQELQEWERDAYWHVWVGEDHYRIPRPFEVGALFSMVPERAVRALLGEDDTRVVGQAITRTMMDTFAFNPLPQLFKPIYEQYNNKLFFTGRPIVGLAQEGMKPEAQYNERTSPTLIEIAKAMPGSAPEWLRSPVRLEALVRGYLGSMGMASVAAADGLTRGGMGYPDAPAQAWYETAFSRFLRAGEPRSTKYTDELYRMAEEANHAARTVNEYRKNGRIEEAKAAGIEYREQIQARVKLNKLVAGMRRLNEAASRVMNNATMLPETKRERLDEINKRRNDIARLSAQYSDYF